MGVQYLKAAIYKTINKFGYTLRKLPKKDHRIYHKLYSQETLTKRPFYNIGAGKFYHPLWINIDFASDWYRDVQNNFLHYDLMALSPLPIATATAEIFYTSHTIEHVTEAAVANLFKEVHRALKPGGIFRVTTGPDADLDFAALMRKDTDWFYWFQECEKPGTYEAIFKESTANLLIEEKWLHHVASQLVHADVSPSQYKFTAQEIKTIILNKGKEKSLDYFTSLCEFQAERPGNHISWWNVAKLSSFLQKAGFNNVYRSGYLQSISPVLRDESLFDNTHPAISIYMEAIKN